MPMTISIDDALKKEFTEVCKEIGLPPSTAIGVFAKAVVRERRIPFTLSAINTAERESNAGVVSDADRFSEQQTSDLQEVNTASDLPKQEARQNQGVPAEHQGHLNQPSPQDGVVNTGDTQGEGGQPQAQPQGGQSSENPRVQFADKVMEEFSRLYGK